MKKTIEIDESSLGGDYTAGKDGLYAIATKIEEIYSHLDVVVILTYNGAQPWNDEILTVNEFTGFLDKYFACLFV